jgi:hypothetical protein
VAADNGRQTHKEADMKYMLLIYQNPANWSDLGEEARNDVMQEAGAIVQELTESGELIGGDALADHSRTRTVRVRSGIPAVTDGPFLEAKEHLVGYCMIDCETPERALEVATRWPDARHWAVELRPVLSGGTEA